LRNESYESAVWVLAHGAVGCSGREGTYLTAGDGIDEFVVATDAGSGRERWRTRIYTVPIKKQLETDVQTIYITKLKLSGAALFVRDEAKRCYQLDVKTQNVETAGCSAMKAAKSTATATAK
jgi:hypothetical protein